MLYNGSCYTQPDKNKDNRYIQAILQQKCPAVKGVFIIFPFLRPFLHKREFGYTQHIDQMIFPDKSCMSSVLYLRQFLIQLHFRIKTAVLIHILFVFYFLAIGKLRKRFLMLLLQQSHIIRMFSLYKHFFLCTALFHRLVVVLVKMLVQIRLRLRNQLGNLFLILRFHRFRFIHGGLKLCSPRHLLFLRKAMVPLHSVYFALKRNYLI